ncbi:MAG: protein kinase [Gemmatimonadaceae bacterium]
MTDLRDELQATLSGTYTLERELGGGGMSRVFVATETALGRSVVVKVLPPELTGGVNIDRFRREILLAAKLQHPHIVPVLAAGEMNGIPYYTMPFVEGRSLRARLEEGGALPIGEATSILRDVAKALAYAHERGVVHRDIKPDNVLVTGGAAVVTDFGIAKAISEAKLKGPGETLTQIGTSLGTPAYMAPEQAAADPSTDHRADMYAFGCMAFELLAGRPPFVGKSPQKLLAAQMGQAPETITSLRADTPPALAAMVMRCLEKDADDRPQRAADLLSALDSASTSDQQLAMSPILLGGRRMLLKALAAYVVAVLAVVIVAKASIVAIGLPEWVLPGALIVMALGLPVILFTAYVHYATHREAIRTPTLTPRGTRPSRGTMAEIAAKASPHMTWRRTTRGGVFAIAAFVLLVTGFMAMRALGIGPAGSLLAAGKLNDANTLVVADFVMKGGDSSLANVVTEAVRTGLSESQIFTILSPAAVSAALQRMQLSPASRVDSALAHNVAIREGAKAYVAGEVTPFGQGFAIAMRLVAADSGTVLASFQQTADGPSDLLATIDKLTRNLRGKAGESLRKIHADKPLDQVTTTSLEALRKYVAASRAVDASRSEDAIPLLKEAIALDTNFASGYRKLAIAYRNAGMPPNMADTALANAYRHRDRLTEREKGLLVGTYFFSGPGRDRARSIAAYEAVLRDYPTEGVAINNLALALSSRRETIRAESLYRRAVEIDPGPLTRYENLTDMLIHNGKLRAADSLVDITEKRFPTSILPTLDRSMLAYIRGDLDSSETLLRSLLNKSTPRDRSFTLYAISDMTTLRGRLAESYAKLVEARRADSARGVPMRPLDDSLDRAFVDIWMREQGARGVQKVDAALARQPMKSLPVERRPYFLAASLYALGGRPDRAREVIAQYAADVKDTVLLRLRTPGLHNALGEISLAEQKPLEAVKEFRLGDVATDGPASNCRICLTANLARAFDQAGMADSALAAFERYVGTSDASRAEYDKDPTFLAGTYKRLGELYEAKNDKAKAASYYRKFVDLWKNADPELQPKVAEVRRRIARLGGIEGH